MATETLAERAPAWPPPELRPRLDRVLGHPLAFVATAALLLGLFGWTFVSNPDRVAPTKDPAYYTWRTEALMSEPPVRFLQIEGAFDMFSGGYRVTAPVLGAFLRQIGGIGSLKVTVLFMVLLPVGTALLLGGFAFRVRQDPLIFHSVALGSASLFLTPPFVGYLDNLLCLFWLAAALPFIERTRYSGSARAAFFLLLLLAGLTHPTTLVIFCATLGLMAAWRLLWRKFELKSVVSDDGPMLLVAFGSVVATYAVWKLGIWGESASLGDAALPPPYGSDFFVDRLLLWVKAMRPLLNGPLFLIGVAGLIAAARRPVAPAAEPDEVPPAFSVRRSPLEQDDLTRTALVWLAPLAGLFGFVGGLTYPYYRFFNTTLAWVLLVGIGIFVVTRSLIDVARKGGAARLVLAGIAALGIVVATNFTTGFRLSGWNNAGGGWLSAQERADLDVLRGRLAREDPDRPVVFVIDQEDRDFTIWGFTKLAGNTSRYGLPPGQIDRGYLYLGSLDNYIAGEPTLVGEETYDKLSPALLVDAQEGIAEAGEEPIVVVAAAFNETGANSGVAEKGGRRPEFGPHPETWYLNDGRISSIEATTYSAPEETQGLLHVGRVLLGLLVLLLPGFLAFHYFLPDGRIAEGLGLVPALSLALLAATGILVAAVVKAPFSPSVAWTAVGVAAAAALIMNRSISRASALPPERVIYGP